MKGKKKRYSIFVTKYSKDYSDIEDEKVLKRTNSKLFANYYLKDRMGIFMDFYRSDSVIECTVYDHYNHKAVGRCTYFNRIRSTK